MAQGRPITGAVQDIVGGLLRGQQFGLQREEQERKQQAIIEAAELKRRQQLEDRENLALNIENALGGFSGLPSTVVEDDGIVERDQTFPTERRTPGRADGLVFTEKQRKAFSRAVAINPSSSGPILNFLSKANEFDLQQQQNVEERNLRTGIRLRDAFKKGRLPFLQSIRQEIESGLHDQQTVQELLNLSREEDQDQIDLDLNKFILDGTDKKTLIEEEVLKRKEARTPQPGFTLTPGQVRFGATGEEIARVAATPPKPVQETTLVRNLQAAGIDPKSTEGIDIIKKSLTKPGVKINLSEGLDFKIPLGFMLLDKNDPTKGVTPIPGGPKDNLTSENAAKTQMLQTAKKGFQGARKLIFNKDGSLNRTNLFNAAFGTFFTDGRKLRIKMEFGIQAITRLETGAAMPENEVENTRTRFMPTIGDTVEIAELKLQMFEDFLNGTLKLIDPSGRFNAGRFDSELQNRLVIPNGTAPIAPGPVTPTGAQPQRNIVVDF